jgi:uncharacterized MAPEG superfamily protein
MPASLNTLLAASIFLGLAHILLAGLLGKNSRGSAWSVGNRDGEAPPLSVHAGRAQRASQNFLETFPFFAAALVCAIAVGRQGYLVVLGAQLYFWARLVYLPIYVLGIPVARSIAWVVATAGIVLIVITLI